MTIETFHKMPVKVINNKTISYVCFTQNKAFYEEYSNLNAFTLFKGKK